MTKSVRIENADTSNHKVRVREQVKVNGEWQDVTAPATNLDYPTAMALVTIWAEKRLIVEEYTV